MLKPNLYNLANKKLYMKRTILITGTSSGIGKSTALYFQKKGWNVVATMRNPEDRKTELHKTDMDLMHLDVLDKKSIKKAFDHVSKNYNTLDAVVNNAGYGIFGPFEYTKSEDAEKNFHTNVLGLMDVTRSALKQMKKQNSGTIINVSSIAGKICSPFFSIYYSTKHAIEGFSESLYYELKPFNIKVKIIEPGFIDTGFLDSLKEVKAKDYKKYAKKTKEYMENQNRSDPVEVAKTIFKAATDDNWKLRYPTGKSSRSLLFLKRIIPHPLFKKVTEMITT